MSIVDNGFYLWQGFKKNYKKLEIVKENLKNSPNSVIIDDNKESGVELEIKSFNFIKHGNTAEKYLLELIIEDKLNIIKKGVNLWTLK